MTERTTKIVIDFELCSRYNIQENVGLTYEQRI